METKECICCNKERDIDRFTPLSWSKDSTLNRDNTCDICKSKNNIPNNIGNLNPNDWKLTTYRMNEHEYNVLFEAQEGKCKICGKHQSVLERRLAVDHNHVTDEVRGLLCNTCNTGIGLLKENIENFKNAIKYLETTKNGIARSNKPLYI